MLYKIMMATFLLGSSLITMGCGFAQAEKPLAKIRDTSNLFDEATNAVTILSDCNYDRVDLKSIITSATKVLDFFEKHLDQLVVDAAIGTRIMESQLNLLQLGHPNLPQTFQALTMSLKLRCKRLSESIIDKLTSSEMSGKKREQFVQNLYWVNDTSLWESPSIRNWQSEDEVTLNVSNTTLEHMESEDEITSEEVSDRCTSDILQKCNVTDECSEMFLEKITSKYSLTHQIFYFLFAKKKNCFMDNNFILKMGNITPKKFMNQMCQKVWEEANAIQESDFPVLYIDLLCEQVISCSLLGYTKFLKLSWLKVILSSQSESGCYTFDINKNSSEEAIQEQNRRVKRSDNMIQMGVRECSVHFTTVALSAMAMHLRYFGDTCLRNYEGKQQ